MGKTDQILNHIIGMKEHLGNIDGHLKELNGKVNTNTKDIKDNEKEVKRIDKKIAYYTGAVGVIITLLMVIVQWIFKYKL